MDIGNRFIRWKRESMLKRSNVNRDTGVGVRKNCLIENNNTRNIDPPRCVIKLASIVLAETRPTSTPKNLQRGIIGLNMKQAEQGRVLVGNRSGHTVDEITYAVRNASSQNRSGRDECASK